MNPLKLFTKLYVWPRILCRENNLFTIPNRFEAQILSNSRIFTDRENVARVNALVHPRVKEDFLAWAESAGSDVVAVESAILYESGMADTVDKVLLVWADRETAVERVMRRSGLVREQVISRLQNQMSVDELLLLSDYEVCNDGVNAILPYLVEFVAGLRG